MASAAMFCSLRRRSPTGGTTFAQPPDLRDASLVRALADASSELLAASSAALSIPFQRKNTRSLLRKLEIFAAFFDALKAQPIPLPSAASLCFKELYILICRSQSLLDYCSVSSSLWLLIQNLPISGDFHDLQQDTTTLLDVLPVGELGLPGDVHELVRMLHRQSRRAKLFVDPRDEALRLQLFSFLDEFEQGRVPDAEDLRSLFVDELGIRNAKSCRREIEFLEDQVLNHDDDMEPTNSLLNSFVALTRYCRFLLFGFREEVNDDDHDDVDGIGKLGKITELSSCTKWEKRFSKDTEEPLMTIPKDFCCPISFELMRDPVIVSTGQTYDRSAISKWIDDGHCSCPKTGQKLSHTRLVANRALRGVISRWCAANGVPFDLADRGEMVAGNVVHPPAAAKAAIEADRATTVLLVAKLLNGSSREQMVAVQELRLMTKTGKENRSCIAEAGAIPLLKKLLASPCQIMQENSVTAMLNLSILDKNKDRIMEEEGCLESIVDVLRHGITEESRENAAATLFSLSSVHDYKTRITDREGALEALAGLLTIGSSRGKKDAVMALFNLSTHSKNCLRMVEAGATSALVRALWMEGVAEEAAGALLLLMRKPGGMEAVSKEEDTVDGLVSVMRCGTPRGKENAVAALLELCRNGSPMLADKVVRTPAIASLLHCLTFTGTRRARRKAASLARVCQRCEAAMDRWGMTSQDYSLSGNSEALQGESFTGDVPVTMISVPAL